MDTTTEVLRAPARVAKPTPSAPKPTAQAAAPAPKAKRLRYPCKLALAVSIEMAESLKRLTAVPDGMSETEIVRLALKTFLMHSDPVYRQQVSGNGNG